MRDSTVDIIKQKLTSHNEFAIDRISISRYEYMELVSDKCTPKFIPESIIIRIEK